MEGDKAFYYLQEDGDFKGGVITHVDDFTIARTTGFIRDILKTVKEELTIFKVEHDNFRYTGKDISAEEAV